MQGRCSESRTGFASTCAATAHAQLAKTERVSLPPKPPPMRTTFETTLFCGSAHAFATHRCVLSTACVEASTWMPPS